jgi:signal transduction histidine kinase
MKLNRIISSKTGKKRTEETNAVEEKRFLEYSARMEKLLEQEKQRISREIHDDLGQILTVLKIDLVGLMKNPPPAEELAKKLQPIIDLANQGIDSARRLSFELRPGILDQKGLIPALEWLLDEIQKRSNIHFNVQFPNEVPGIKTEQAVVVYRVFQEILTNIVRHAKASSVLVSLVKKNNQLQLVVADDGIGFEYKAPPRSLGLLGMTERAKIHGGTLHIETSPGKGTQVMLKLPLD